MIKQTEGVIKKGQFGNTGKLGTQDAGRRTKTNKSQKRKMRQIKLK